ncbi:MAG: ABC transporter substrate-binding protein [Terriglobales bacterium]
MSAAAAQAGLTIPLASDPQTLNPVFATDSARQLLASLTMADLMHINPSTLKVEPRLASAVVQLTPRRWIVHLRPHLQFSDGAPFTAADVAFSFRVYTDPRLATPERQLLTLAGKPVECRVLDALTVELDLPAPAAVGERLLDSVWMLPRHRLESVYRAGKLATAWGLDTPPADVVGLGPFRLAQVQPGREIGLQRNPYYWSGAARLPWLRLPVIPDPNLRLTLFVRGKLDGLPTLSEEDGARLQGRSCCRILDAGPGLNDEVLVLNQAPGPEAARTWFRLRVFRQALSLALDRENLVRNVFGGRAAPLASLTSPGNRAWADPAPAPRADPGRAVQMLQQAGFQLRQGRLYDPKGRRVAFSLIVPATNAARGRMAVYLQADCARLGIAVHVTPLNFQSYLDRLLHRDDFDAALVGIQIPDADPNEESNIWPLDAPWHFWNPHPAHPAPWEAELDRDFRLQQQSVNLVRRRRLYRDIQDIEHENLPLIPLVAPDVVVAARSGLDAVRPALLPPHLLWNVDQLNWGRR